MKKLYNIIGEKQLNNQGELMQITSYNNYSDVIVQFQDEYKAEVHTTYGHFQKGSVRNPYAPSVCGVGILGNKYPSKENYENTKEYKAWQDMLRRCFDDKTKEKHPTYKNVTCCNEWLYFEKFYEWLHNQSNFEKWYNNDGWAVDKDIIIKNNKTYSPNTCCLVSQTVNNLFKENVNKKNNLPIGVTYHKQVKKYCAQLSRLDEKNKHVTYLGYFDTVEEAFLAYKKAKEELIKQVAQIEYSKDNITKQCYEAIMRYQVEITD